MVYCNTVPVQLTYTLYCVLLSIYALKMVYCNTVPVQLTYTLYCVLLRMYIGNGLL